MVILYRAQPANQPAYVRSLEVRYDCEAPAGPYEQFDLTEFCCSTRHALTAGAYYLSRRRHITHTLKVQVLPMAELAALDIGDVVKITMPRVGNLGDDSAHCHLYQVSGLTQDAAGVTQLDLTHFPVDRSGRSLVALDVLSFAPNVIVPAARVTVATGVVLGGAPTIVVVPSFAVAAAANAPTWANATSMRPDVVALTVTAWAPAIDTANIRPPAAAVAVAGNVPLVYVAGILAQVAPVAVAANAPSVTINGVQVTPAGVAVAANAPQVLNVGLAVPVAAVVVAANVPSVIAGYDVDAQAYMLSLIHI